MTEHATFDLYETEREYPDLLAATVTGPRDFAWREINHCALLYGQGGPVKIVERTETGDD